MLRSMYTAISGLRTHQFKMDIIGNNIANVNTVGFKKSQVSFQEVFSQTTSGASAPQGGRGGTNPQQVGLGVSVGSVRVIHEPGSPQRTDNPLDFYVGGDGYFVVSGDPNFSNRSYTRAGNFDLDRDGTLVTGEGLKVLGYKVDEKGNISDTLGDIKIDKSNTVEASKTTGMSIKGNLDSREAVYEMDKDGNYKVYSAADEAADPTHKKGTRIPLPESKRTFKTDTTIYDSLGNPYTVTYKIGKEPNSKVAVEIPDITEVKYTPTPVAEPPVGDDRTDYEKYLQDVIDGRKLYDKDYATAYAKAKVEWDKEDNDVEWNISIDSIKDSKGNVISPGSLKPAKIKFGSDGKLSGGTPTLSLTDLPPTNGGSFEQDIEIDISGLTQYGNERTAKAYREDGNTSGVIDSFSVSKSGEIVAVYTNGESKVLAQVALAKFDNPGGLSKEGSNLFKDTRNSGEPQFGFAGASGYGQMLGGAVEMSNVDLSNEFTEMITTQRGFQANSRVITTSDEILQELVNLKR